MYRGTRKLEFRNTFKMSIPKDQVYSNTLKSRKDDNTNLECVSSDDVANAIETNFKLEKLGKTLIWGVLLGLINRYFLIVPVVGILLIVYVHSTGKVYIEYTSDAQDLKEHINRIKAWQRLSVVNKKWQVLSEKSTHDQKRNAGATSTISRVGCTIVNGTPRFMNVNVDAIRIGLANKETLVFLPDAAYYIRKDRVMPLKYSDMNIDVYSDRFIEEGSIPSDAKEIDCTWKYVNANGLPDRRFKDNRAIPVCLYGRVVISVPNKLKIDLQLSNWLSTQNFQELIRCGNINDTRK